MIQSADPDKKKKTTATAPDASAPVKKKKKKIKPAAAPDTAPAADADADAPAPAKVKKPKPAAAPAPDAGKKSGGGIEWLAGSIGERIWQALMTGPQSIDQIKALGAADPRRRCSTMNERLQAHNSRYTIVYSEGMFSLVKGKKPAVA